MFYQTFLSPQVKRCGIITNKHGIYELPDELPNNLGFRTLGNLDTSGECLNPHNDKPAPSPPRQIENFVNASKKLLKNRD